MTTRTTVAIDKELRKRLRKLSAWLDITQAEVIKRALSLFEKEIIQNMQTPKKQNYNKKSESDIEKILKDATKVIWEKDPERRTLQRKLSAGPEIIDDFILDNWYTGLEE